MRRLLQTMGYILLPYESIRRTGDVRLQFQARRYLKSPKHEF